MISHPPVHLTYHKSSTCASHNPQGAVAHASFIDSDQTISNFGQLHVETQSAFSDDIQVGEGCGRTMCAPLPAQPPCPLLFPPFPTDVCCWVGRGMADSPSHQPAGSKHDALLQDEPRLA